MGRRASGGSTETRVDPEVAERLAALGYVGGSGGSPAASGVDPKDRIAVANMLHEAILAVEDGAFARAVPLLERVTAIEPNIPIAQLNLGRRACAPASVRAGDRAAAARRGDAACGDAGTLRAGHRLL